MKKLSVILVFAIIFTAVAAVTALPALAADPPITAPQGTVTIDGQAAAGEWTGAPTLTYNAANGNIPSWVSNPTGDGLTVSYQFKWDTNNFYILENRTNGVNNLNFRNNIPGQVMWMGDNTLFFITVSGSGTVQDFEYAANQKDGSGPVIQKRDADGTTITYPLTGASIAATVNGKNAITEIAIPWSAIAGSAAVTAARGMVRVAPSITQVKSNGIAQDFQYDTTYNEATNSPDDWQEVDLGLVGAAAITAPRGTATVDGAVTGSEWAGAPTLTYDGTNGVIPSWVSNPAGDGLTVSYKFMWDATNFYVLEDRTNGVNNLNFRNNIPGQVMWMGDNTLFFMTVPGSDTFQDFEYAANQKDGSGPVIQGRAADGTTITYPLTGASIAATVSGKHALTEIAIPWSAVAGSAGIAAIGNMIRLAPIIAQVKSSGIAQDYQYDTTYDNGMGAWQPVVLGDAVTLGDVDLNGKINVQDAIAILKHVTGSKLLTGQGLANADVNHNGKINVQCAVTILKYVTGQIKAF